MKESIIRLRKEEEGGRQKLLECQGKSQARQLDAMLKKINDQVGAVRLMEAEIDLVREEKARLRGSLAACQLEVTQAHQEVQRLAQEAAQAEADEQAVSQDILAHKEADEKEKSLFYGRMIGLNRDRDEKRALPKHDHSGFVQNETLPILKNKVLKLIVNNKEKVKLIENYQRSMKSIDDSFNLIKEATGITDIE